MVNGLADVHWVWADDLNLDGDVADNWDVVVDWNGAINLHGVRLVDGNGNLVDDWDLHGHLDGLDNWVWDLNVLHDLVWDLRM